MRARLLLLAGALVAFGASLGSGFHFDDYAIFSDPALTPEGFVDFWSLRQTRPLTYFTFSMNHLLGGGDPLGYHLLNLALHLGAVLVAYECLRRLLPERAALIAVAIFAVHPIQAEAVNYVWGRSIVLATLLTLASLYAWITDRRWVAVAWFAAALLAKEEVAAFPLVLAIVGGAVWKFKGGDKAPGVDTSVDAAASKTLSQHCGTGDSPVLAVVPRSGTGRAPLADRRNRLSHPHAPSPIHWVFMQFGGPPGPFETGTSVRATVVPLFSMLALSLAAGARVIYATTVTPGAPAGAQAGITPWHYLMAQGPVILRYLRLLAIPYGFTVDPEIGVPPAWLGLAAWAAILGAIGLALRRRKAWSFWLLAGLVLLIPSSSVFPAADLAADRRMYFALLAFAAAAGLLLERVKPQAIAAGLVVALTLVSVGRTQVWMSEESLWREAVHRAPEKVRPKIQLARALPAAAALEVLAEARNLAPYDPAVAAETGKTLLGEGQPEAALQEFGRALALNPRDARNLNNRGVALEAIGQTEAARADFERALRIDPGLTEARLNLQKLVR
jgi:hypothetical protein